MKEKIKRITARVLSLVTGICIAALAASGLLLFAPRMFAVTPYIVMSGSMEPVLQTGGIAFVNTKEKDLKIKDVITFHADDRLVTHRIIRMDGQYFYTKGDANTKEDSVPVSKEQIIGKVCMGVPYLGFLAAFLQSKQGMLALLVLLFSHMLSRDLIQDHSNPVNET